MKPLVLVLCGDVRETMEKFTKMPLRSEQV